MLLSEAKWVFLGFILCISEGRHICVLKGSFVNLTCPEAESAGSTMWYTAIRNESVYSLKELPADGNYITHNVDENYNATLTIVEVLERDETVYCCQKDPKKAKLCWEKGTELHVADLQVKVFPASEGQKVTLMCTTSCALTESPAAFIWYQNTEVLYEDWSPWYQELVSSENSVRYSCAVKGYEELRAPEVSVDSVTPACFVVKYAKGRMCAQKSVDEPCSVTYPRDVRVQVNQEASISTLTCNSSCPAAVPHTEFRWYLSRMLFPECESQVLTAYKLSAHITCAVKSNEDLLAKEICLDPNCINANYIRSRVCMLEGSSVNISIAYSHQPPHPFWFKITRIVEGMIDTVVRVEYSDRVKGWWDNQRVLHTLRIHDLKKNDSGEYMFSLHICEHCRNSDLPGVMLVITGLKVTATPSAEVTEGQKVTLTCTTSCPLTDTVYIWYFNSQPLDLPEIQSKHLVLNPVGHQHAGNYSCAVKTPQNINSTTEALTVKARQQSVMINNILKLAVILLIPLVGLTLCTMMRRRKSVSVSEEIKDETELVDPLCVRAKPRVKNPPTEGQQEQQQEDAM
ncbi:B-cell receptor CD22-like [Kryptolebias marmoratus]|uniref:B-cell receptor CD22-like n=1 Tax=Kryptolebias marmoratus TaxID=37003 RepID=A0A3Q3FME0_KRYMA|nr:B-cell receptor CD22-like [Kryptolebias marmoratus]